MFLPYTLSLKLVRGNTIITDIFIKRNAEFVAAKKNKNKIRILKKKSISHKKISHISN